MSDGFGHRTQDRPEVHGLNLATVRKNPSTGNTDPQKPIGEAIAGLGPVEIPPEFVLGYVADN